MNMKIPFMKYRKIAGTLSIIIFFASILTLGFRGLTLGLDFSGGTLVEISYEEPVELEEIRSVLIANNYEDSQVVNFGTDLDVLIKVADQSGNSQLGDQIFVLLNESGFPGTLKRSEFVGPQIGSELRDQGGVGMLVALFMILLYVAFRFQYKFALGAVSALGHDVVIVLGCFSIFAWDFDLTVLAALLAVIGYSLNDTVVVFDRVREYMNINKKKKIHEFINNSLNSTLSRTINTSLTTFFVLLIIFIFGGEVIRGFMFALMVGVIVGTYSSLFIASPIMLDTIKAKDDAAKK